MLCCWSCRQNCRETLKDMKGTRCHWNCDRELQLVTNNTSDLHWTCFRALSAAVDTFNIVQQSSAFRNCRLGAAPHRNPTERTVCSTENVMPLRAAEFGQALYSVRLLVLKSTQHATQICGLWPSWLKCSFTKWAALHGLAAILRTFFWIRWFYLGQPMAFLHHLCFQQTKKIRDRLILAFCSSLQEAGVQGKNTMETVCVWREISEQHAHSALELFEISSRVLWSINPIFWYVAGPSWLWLSQDRQIEQWNGWKTR